MNGRLAAVEYDFGPFRLRPADRVLLRDGEPVAITPKVFDLLVAFVRDRGRALPRGELLETVWPGTFVDEGSLTRTVSLLRRTLGVPGYIETVSKFGYRFTAPVREEKTAQAVSIAVLPFTHLGEADTSYLSVGLADAVIAKLARVRNLTVRPTSAVLRFAERKEDAAAAARALDVDLVLEGTLRAANGRIRVTAHLVRGERASAVWSSRFEAALADLFSLEDALAEQIVTALEVQLSAAEQQQMARRATVDPEAHRLYLKGRHFWARRNPQAVQKALAYFEEAIGHDPQYALAYCGVADAYLVSSDLDPAVAAERARTAARRALELDPSLGEAHTTLARIEMAFDWNWKGAEERFQRALALHPGYLTARQWRAHLLTATGRTAEAIAEIEAVRSSDPLSPALLTASAWIHYMARRNDEAITRYNEALELDPAFVHARRQIGIAYERAGRFDEAIATQREVLRSAEHDPLALALLAHAHAAAGDDEAAREVLAKLALSASTLQIAAATHLALGDETAALDLLDRACAARASTLMWLLVDPWFDPLRAHPHFQRVLRQLGLSR